MSIYEERLERDIDVIRDKTSMLGAMVAKAVADSATALLEGDKRLANDTIIGDKPINRLRKEVINLCIAFMAVHSPGAGHLRQVASIMRMAENLERCGDHAVTVAREAIQIPHLPTGIIKEHMESMADHAVTGLEQSMQAFADKNVELAAKTRLMAAQAKGNQDSLFNELVDVSGKEDVRYLFEILITIAQVKRISDRVKNLCEETIFMTSGDVKTPRAFKFLFLDTDNNCQSQIAEAVARKNFPLSGHYASAGNSDKADLAPGLVAFMESKGLVQNVLQPKILDKDMADAGAYDIIISLQGPVSDYLDRQPFRTMFFDWDISAARETESDTQEHYVAMHREIKANIHDLLITLRGEGAE